MKLFNSYVKESKMAQDKKYLSQSGLIELINLIKNKFSEKIHIHEISDVDGLQKNLTN